MKVSIVIPNWNGRHKLEQNLPKVLEVLGVDEVIVVDDCSTDDSVSYLETNYPQIKLIKTSKNSGFATAVNAGVKECLSDLIFLLNSDAVPEKDCLKNVLPHFKDKRVFSVGFNTGGNYSWAYFKDGYFWHYMTKDVKPVTHQTLWASGGSGVFRRDLWESLGGFDEIYNPFYEEDLDLGYRATKRGFINIWEVRAKVEHYKQIGVIKENFSDSRVASIAQRNQLYFIWKNVTSDKLIEEHRVALFRKVFTNPKYILVFFAALKNISYILKKRAVEKKFEVITDEEILAKF